MSRKFDLDHLFKYHQPVLADGSPDEEKIKRYQNIRAAARHFAEVIENNVPDCADKSEAVRLVRNAMMTSNAGIATDGRLHIEG